MEPIGGKWYMLLTGSFKRTVDEKQRIAIPKRIRESLGGDESRLFITPSTDGALNLFPPSTFQQLADKLKQAPPAEKNVRAFSRLFFSRAECLEMDKQGRIRIPAELVNLTAEIMLIGVGDHLELWVLSKWQDYLKQNETSYDELAERAFGDSNSI